MQLVYFKNSHLEEYRAEEDEDAVASLSIDGFPEDENESGEVVARVWITKHKDIVIDWHNNGYRFNDAVLGLIEDSKEKLRERYGS